MTNPNKKHLERRELREQGKKEGDAIAAASAADFDRAIRDEIHDPERFAEYFERRAAEGAEIEELNRILDAYTEVRLTQETDPADVAAEVEAFSQKASSFLSREAIEAEITEAQQAGDSKRLETATKRWENLVDTQQRTAKAARREPTQLNRVRAEQGVDGPDGHAAALRKRRENSGPEEGRSH